MWWWTQLCLFPPWADASVCVTLDDGREHCLTRRAFLRHCSSVCERKGGPEGKPGTPGPYGQGRGPSETVYLGQQPGCTARSKTRTDERMALR